LLFTKLQVHHYSGSNTLSNTSPFTADEIVVPDTMLQSIQTSGLQSTIFHSSGTSFQRLKMGPPL